VIAMMESLGLQQQELENMELGIICMSIDARKISLVALGVSSTIKHVHGFRGYYYVYMAHHDPIRAHISCLFSDNPGHAITLQSRESFNSECRP